MSYLPLLEKAIVNNENIQKKQKKQYLNDTMIHILQDFIQKKWIGMLWRDCHQHDFA